MGVLQAVGAVARVAGPVYGTNLLSLDKHNMNLVRPRAPSPRALGAPRPL